MITILSMLEASYKSTYEHLAFRQLKGAYKCNLVCVPHNYATFQEALDATKGRKIFMVPPGRAASKEFSDFILPDGDVVFCFGSPEENMLSYVGRKTALHITTPDPTVDMMAVCVAAQVLSVHG